MSIIQLLSVSFSLFIFILIFEMVRKKRIKEEYSLLWFFMGSVFFLLSLFPSTIDFLGKLFGIHYAPTLILLIIIGFLIMLMIHFSIVISKLSNVNKELLQEMGLLKNEIETLKDT